MNRERSLLVTATRRCARLPSRRIVPLVLAAIAIVGIAAVVQPRWWPRLPSARVYVDGRLERGARVYRKRGTLLIWVGARSPYNQMSSWYLCWPRRRRVAWAMADFLDAPFGACSRYPTPRFILWPSEKWEVDPNLTIRDGVVEFTSVARQRIRVVPN